MPIFNEDDGTIHQSILDGLDVDDLNKIIDDPDDYTPDAFRDADELDDAPDPDIDENLPPSGQRIREEEQPEEDEEEQFDEFDRAPEKWKIDPKTGEYWKNGLILGKYRTLEDAQDAVPEMLSLVGRKAESAPVSPDPIEYRGEIVTDISAADREQLAAYALESALRNPKITKRCQEKGITPPSNREELEELESVAPGLYAQIDLIAQDEEQRLEATFQEYEFYSAHQEEVNQRAAEIAYENFAREIEEATGIPRDEWEDEDELIDQFNAELDKIQDLPSSHPHFLAYHDMKAGVPVLNPAKLHGYARLRFTSLRDQAIKNATAAEIQRNYEQDRDQRRAPRFPRSIAALEGEGTTGAGTGMMPLESLMESDSLDKFIMYFKREGVPDPEEAAEKEWTRQYEYYAREWDDAHGPVQQRRAPARQVHGTRQY